MTTNMEELQALFFIWFKCYESRNLNQIRVATKNLLASYEYNTEYSSFKIFYPLVRYGLIEFCGNDTYTLSNPILLFYPDNKVVGINLNSVQVEKLKNWFQLYTVDKFGIIRFTATENKLVIFSKETDIPLSKPNISEYLSNFPKVRNCINAINGFEETYFSTFEEKFDIRGRKWEKARNESFGLFKSTENAQKYFFIENGVTYSIPSYTQNPDARPIVESYFYCKQTSFKYNSSTKELNVGNINLPILIERLLRLASLFDTTVYTKEYNNQIYSNITKNTVLQLDRIFDAKTEII
ncbi:MAG: hypothetical protein H6Q14_395 [Bacteroidetes bacterium]|nr:hypothetical protein [Bacteroidota bacterium]MBP1616568.1 hypothetical protein [Bacteroidota bacterium]